MWTGSEVDCCLGLTGRDTPLLLSQLLLLVLVLRCDDGVLQQLCHSATACLPSVSVGLVGDGGVMTIRGNGKGSGKEKETVFFFLIEGGVVVIKGGDEAVKRPCC